MGRARGMGRGLGLGRGILSADNTVEGQQNVASMQPIHHSKGRGILKLLYEQNMSNNTARGHATNRRGRGRSNRGGRGGIHNPTKDVFTDQNDDFRNHVVGSPVRCPSEIKKYIPTNNSSNNNLQTKKIDQEIQQQKTSNTALEKNHSITQQLSTELSELKLDDSSEKIKQLYKKKYTWLDNLKHVSYFKQNKVMYIMRGLPGSGKSTLAQHILKQYEQSHVAVCCADDFRVNAEGKYEWSKEMLGMTHQKCQQEAQKHCKRGTNVVLIDNTNIKKSDFDYYLKLSHQHHYKVVIIEMDERNANVLKRNHHNVPIETLKKMASMFNSITPRYFGWNLGITDTANVKSQLQKILSDLLKVNDFLRCFQQQKIQSSENFFTVYNMKTSTTGSLNCHVTAAFADKKKFHQLEKYGRKPHVKNAIGSLTPLKITGLCITPRSLFARVSLSTEQSILWSCDDSLTDQRKPCLTLNSLFGNGKQNTMKHIFHEAGVTLEGIKNTNNFTRFTSMLSSDYIHPEFSFGSTAHITLGVKPPNKPVEAKQDLVRIITQELTSSHHFEEHYTDFMVRKYDRGMWVVYFKTPIVLPSLFCAFYV